MKKYTKPDTDIVSFDERNDLMQDVIVASGIEWLSFPGTVAGLSDHILEDCPRLETVVFESRLPEHELSLHEFS